MPLLRNGWRLPPPTKTVRLSMEPSENALVQKLLEEHKDPLKEAAEALYKGDQAALQTALVKLVGNVAATTVTASLTAEFGGFATLLGTGANAAVAVLWHRYKAWKQRVRSAEYNASPASPPPSASDLSSWAVEGLQLLKLLHVPFSNLEPETPAQLLSARHRVVPFDQASRQVEWDFLERFCADTPAPPQRQLALQLVTGAGGAGKTRLLMEWCDELLSRSPPWAAGFLAAPRQDEALSLLRTPGPPTMVVLDYAETRQVGNWLQRLLSEGKCQRMLRIVLLARHAGDWWEALGRGNEDLKALKPLDHLPVSRLMLDANERQRHYDTALNAFAKHQHLSTLGLAVTRPALQDTHFARPLYIHMAAFLALSGEASAASDLPQHILERECRFWRPDGWAAPYDWYPPALRLMAAITLLDEVEWDGAKSIAVHPSGLESAEPWLDRLKSLYPIPSSPTPRSGITRLEPDLIGETLVWYTLTQASTPNDFLECLLANATQASIKHALSVLGRIGFKHPQEVRQWAERVFRQDPIGRAQLGFEITEGLAISQAGGVLGQALAAALNDYTDPPLAESWAKRIPRQTVALRELAIWVYRQRYESATSDETKAAASNWLGFFLGTLGRREEALIASQEATELYRQLAKAHPDTFLEDLASALNNLGMMLAGLGSQEEALVATEEAANIRRGLAETQPQTFLPNLARTVNNLGTRFGRLGRRDEALAAAEEAAQLYRALAATNPVDFQPELATTLNNLGMMLAAMGRREEALAATQEATRLDRSLAATRPDAFLPHLARTLNNLGTQFGSLDRQAEALAATQEAIQLYRDLAVARPDAFVTGLASALSNLGTHFRCIGQMPEALDATKEATHLYRELTETLPRVFLPRLARSLDNLSADLLAVGKREEALAAHHEAVQHYRELSDTTPEKFLPELASAVDSLGDRLGRMGQRTEALAATQEAVAMRRELANDCPDEYQPDLAASLGQLGFRFTNLDRRQDAVEAHQEAAQLYRGLSASCPDSFLPDLASSLEDLSTAQMALGLEEEALASQRTAVATYRELARERPDDFRLALARVLGNLGKMEYKHGSKHAGAAFTQEATACYRPLADAEPTAHRPDLAATLADLGQIARNLNQHQKALAAVQEATQIYRDLIDSGHDTFLLELAQTLHDLALIQQELRKRDEALESVQEAIAIRRGLRAAWPHHVQEDLESSISLLHRLQAPMLASPLPLLRKWWNRLPFSNR